jgi:hypothetical protein
MLARHCQIEALGAAGDRAAELRRLLATTGAQHSQLAKAGQPSQTSLGKFH